MPAWKSEKLDLAQGCSQKGEICCFFCTDGGENGINSLINGTGG